MSGFQLDTRAAHMDPHVATVAQREAAIRDNRLSRLASDRDMFLAEAKRVYEERASRIEREYLAARAEVFRAFEIAQDAAVNFVELRRDRAAAARFGLDVPFLHPSRAFGGANRRFLTPEGKVDLKDAGL